MLLTIVVKSKNKKFLTLKKPKIHYIKFKPVHKLLSDYYKSFTNNMYHLLLEQFITGHRKAGHVQKISHHVPLNVDIQLRIGVKAISRNKHY